jgi:hypothetical protein
VVIFMARSLSERLAIIQAKKNTLAAREDALKAKAKSEGRKLDTRRKIVVGGAVLSAMEKDDAFAIYMRSLLGQYVGRQIDRQAIGDLLPPTASSAA